MNGNTKISFAEHEQYDKGCESTAQLSSFLGAAYAALSGLGDFGSLLGGFSRGGSGAKKPGGAPGGGPPAAGVGGPKASRSVGGPGEEPWRNRDRGRDRD
jgi:hypothetical protein